MKRSTCNALFQDCLTLYGRFLDAYLTIYSYGSQKKHYKWLKIVRKVGSFLYILYYILYIQYIVKSERKTSLTVGNEYCIFETTLHVSTHLIALKSLAP